MKKSEMVKLLQQHFKQSKFRDITTEEFAEEALEIIKNSGWEYVNKDLIDCFCGKNVCDLCSDWESEDVN